MSSTTGSSTLCPAGVGVQASLCTNMAMIFTRLEKVYVLCFFIKDPHWPFCLTILRSKCAVTGDRESPVNSRCALDDAGLHLAVRVRSPLGDGRRLQVDQLWSRLTNTRRLLHQHKSLQERHYTQTLHQWVQSTEKSCGPLSWRFDLFFLLARK